jgi:hypothetical protein
MTHHISSPDQDSRSAAADGLVLDELANLLPGQVRRAGDAGWDHDRAGWVTSVDQHPLAVVTALDPTDVVTVVRWAGRRGRSVSVQPVGHGATDAVNGTVLLRTGALDQISVDPAGRTARVGAGVSWGQLLSATDQHGLTALAGSNAGPSVVGMTVGGGLSWFGRKYGLTAHSATAFDVVDALGQLRRVTAEEDPDLFWALRGGGGDFAVVVAVELSLFPAAHVYGGRLLWPVQAAGPVLRAFRDAAASAPEELTLWSQLLQFPPLPQVPLFLRGGAFISVDLTFLGAAEDAEPYLADLRAIPGRVLDTLGTVALAELGDVAPEPLEPMTHQVLSGFLADLDADTIEAFVRTAGADSGSTLTAVQLRHLGGAFARAEDGDGPVGAIAEPYHLFCLGVPQTPAMRNAMAVTLDAVAAGLGEHLTGRTHFDFLGDADPSTAFGPSALARLRHSKLEMDPHGVFRSNRPVLAPHRAGSGPSALTAARDDAVALAASPHTTPLP